MADLHATILAAFGVDPARQYRTPDGRPIKLINGGEVVREVFGCAAPKLLVPALAYQKLPQSNRPVLIELQYGNRHATNWSQANDQSALHPKVVDPGISARIVEPRRFAGLFVYRCRFGPFVEITEEACPGQILRN